MNEFVDVGTYVAVATPKSTETVWVPEQFWIVKVSEVNRLTMEECIDDFGQHIGPKMMHLAGHFLEKEEKLSTKRKVGYCLSNKITYFYKESVLYPYINIVEEKRGLSLDIKEYTEILLYIEQNGFSHL